MKQVMKSLKFYSCFVAVLLFVFLIPAKTEAATYQQINFSSGDNGARTRVGSYYLWGSYDDFGNSYLNVSKSSSAKTGTYIVAMSHRVPMFSIITDGSQVFYTSSNKSYTKQTIYSVNINGKNKKKYATVSGAEVTLKKYYNDQLYYAVTDRVTNSISAFCSISVKTKKIKTIAKNDGFASEGKYIYLKTDNKTNETIKIFDCQKSKVVRTCKLKKSSSETADIVVTKKYFYIIIKNQNTRMNKIYRYAADGTGSPELIIKIECNWINLNNDSYIYYEVNNDTTGYTYYRYNIKKKKSQKISSEVYEKNAYN